MDPSAALQENHVGMTVAESAAQVPQPNQPREQGPEVSEQGCPPVALLSGRKNVDRASTECTRTLCKTACDSKTGSSREASAAPGVWMSLRKMQKQHQDKVQSAPFLESGIGIWGSNSTGRLLL